MESQEKGANKDALDRPGWHARAPQRESIPYMEKENELGNCSNIEMKNSQTLKVSKSGV